LCHAGLLLCVTAQRSQIETYAEKYCPPQRVQDSCRDDAFDAYATFTVQNGWMRLLNKNLQAG